MAAKIIPAVGETFLGSNPAGVRTLKVVAGHSGQSPDVALGTTGTYALVTVGAGALILEVRARVLVAFTASVTLNIGDANNTSGWMATAKVAPQSAVVTGLWTRTTLPTAEAYAGGLVYATASAINVVVGGATVAAGKLEVLVDYIPDFNGLI